MPVFTSQTSYAICLSHANYLANIKEQASRLLLHIIFCLCTPHSGVYPLFFQKLLMAASLHYSPIVKYHNIIAETTAAHTVGSSKTTKGASLYKALASASFWASPPLMSTPSSLSIDRIVSMP